MADGRIYPHAVRLDGMYWVRADGAIEPARDGEPMPADATGVIWRRTVSTAEAARIVISASTIVTGY